MSAQHITKTTPMFENGVLTIIVPAKRAPLKKVDLPKELLLLAEEQGVTVVVLMSGDEEYKASMETIRYQGKLTGGVWTLPIYRWKRKGPPATKQKETEGDVMRRINEEHGKDTIRKGAEQKGCEEC